MNKRLMIALVLSFVILIGFSYLMPQHKATVDQNGTAAPSAQAAQHSQAPQAPAPAASGTAPEASAGTAPAAQTAAPVSVDKVISTVETKKYTLKFDQFGRIVSAVLKEPKYRQDDGKPLDLIDPKRTRPLEVRFKDPAINKAAFEVPYSASAGTLDARSGKAVLTLTQKLPQLTLTKTLTFYPEGHYDLKVELSRKVPYFITTGHRPEADHSRYMIVRGVLVRNSKGVITTVEDGKADQTVKIPDATILSSFDRYYASLFFDFKKPFSVIITPDEKKDPLPFVVTDSSLQLHGYVGPKEWKLFESLDPRLTDAIEFGWFTFLAKPFFRIMLAIYNFVGNWGWAIVLFTLLVKLVLFPLSYKGLLSMQKLKDLAPKMKEIKEKYKSDPAKMNQQMMALYKKHGANPMGGCLPMLLQIPVFFALYRVLLNADELQGAPWILWIHDLSRQDPYFILPILMGVTMFIQQHITPNTMTDPMQQKIFKWFPVIMTFFFLTFPAGLVLYWLTNNILSIAQQYYINRVYDKHKAKLKAAKKQS
ncbi:membrane protein insertase, YidC/Oxa1 family [Nitratifractor salsuginis DSM 16511]|uniref:Membrane protein insertase YidC n=2 Tax=Nitratifractor salsuginis TaxID=269261 RepID=E6WYW8_NITSE|nr:membrane protein insertase, YidC/Oxa1 family [Nitratifractor salsuginis DSM 16511]